MVAMDHRRETYEYRRALTAGEYLGLGQVTEVVGHGERAMGASATGMHHALWNAWKSRSRAGKRARLVALCKLNCRKICR